MSFLLSGWARRRRVDRGRQLADVALDHFQPVDDLVQLRGQLGECFGEFFFHARGVYAR